MPPLWAFGSMWWSDDFHRDLRGTANAQENVLDLATQLQKLRIPASAVLIDRPYGTGQQRLGQHGLGQLVSGPRRDGGRAARSRAGAGPLDRQPGLERSLRGGTAPRVSCFRAAAIWARPPTCATRPLTPGSRPSWRRWSSWGPRATRSTGANRTSIRTRPRTTTSRCSPGWRARASQDRHGDDVFVFARNVADSGRKYAAVWNGDSNGQLPGTGLFRRRRPAQRHDRHADVGVGHRRLPARRRTAPTRRYSPAGSGSLLTAP